ncbi:MAG: hypothetical protein HYW50_03800 [Candidatus Diapherotrites archaeon]|nr:hypothetical protein [Candidatus Diapherotrites archaeon]
MQKKQKGIIFIGADHSSHALTIACRNAIQKHGKPGQTLFIEGTQKAMRSDNPDAVSFYAAFEEAKKTGMKIVFLDRPKFGDVWIARRLQRRHPIELVELSSRYLYYNLREDRWMKTIDKMTRRGNIVIMHPNHLENILQRRPEFRKSSIFLSKPVPAIFQDKPLNAQEIQKMREWRAKRRWINQRKRLP